MACGSKIRPRFFIVEMSEDKHRVLEISARQYSWFFFWVCVAVWQPSTTQADVWNSPAVRVSTAQVKQEKLFVYLKNLGSVVPVSTVVVRPRVEGQLMRVFFKEGQQVKAGALLAEIDPRPFEVLLTQSEGQLARDQSLLANAQADLVRYRDLFAEDSIAKQQLDTQAALVKQYEAAIKSDRGQVDSARLQLTYARVTAPISGRLGLRHVDAGNIVNTSDLQGLVTITQLQPITVVFSIPEDHLPLVAQKLQLGKKLPVTAYDRSQKNKLADGVLLTMDNQIDPSTGTIKLKAQFPNVDSALFPNQFVNVSLLVDVKEKATVVPSAAIQLGEKGTYVYVVNADRKALLRSITVGVVNGENTAVENGLEVGESVVVDGIDRLQEGALVELQK